MGENRLIVRVSSEIVEIFDLNHKPSYILPTDTFLRYGEEKLFVKGRRNFISYCGCVLSETPNRVKISFKGEVRKVMGNNSPLTEKIISLSREYGTAALNSALERFVRGGNLSVRKSELPEVSSEIIEVKQKEIGLPTGIFNPLTGNQFYVLRADRKFYPTESTHDYFPVKFFGAGGQKISFDSYNDCIIFIKNHLANLLAPTVEEEEKRERTPEEKRIARGKNRVRKIK